MQLEDFDKAKAVAKDIADLSNHKAAIAAYFNSDRLTIRVYDHARRCDEPLRPEFMLLTPERNIQLYLDNVQKKINELEADFINI